MTGGYHSGDGGDQQLQPDMVLQNRYQIQDVIGLGGMGSVYRARDLHFPNADKMVAVKEMINQSPDPLVRRTIVHNFEREANILVSLSHPSIPKILDYFSNDQRSYLVLEYVHGKNLEALLSESKNFFPEEQVILWMVEICEVLRYLHAHKPQPIVFRDIKPSNIIVNQQGHAILIDFGIAKLFKEGQRGTMIGTEGYSPPEQYRGEATPLADIYSLGATMHHLLTRRDPRLEAPFTFAERKIREINPAISVELEVIISTALQYNPQDRFQSIDAMKEALMQAARKTGILNRINSRTASLPGEQKIEPLWTFQCEDEIRGTPICDGSIVYVGAYDSNLYAIQASDGTFRWKYPTAGGIVGQPLLHEGAVLFGSEDKTLYAVSTRTGNLVWTYHTDGAIRCSPRIIEGHVLIGSDDGCLHMVNPATTRRVWLLDVNSPVRSTPFVDGESIYIGCDNGDFICCDFSQRTRWRFRAKRSIFSSPLVDDGVVYFSSLDSTLYALDARSGWVIWRFRMGRGSVSSPCKMGNLLFIGSADSHIYCVDAGSAKEVWRFMTDHQVSGSPVVHKDSIYIGSADGKVYCLEYRSGRLRWAYQTEGVITGSIHIYKDVLYFGSADRRLYALAG